MAEWEQMMMDFMVEPKDENASWSGETKNRCVAAAVGGYDWSQGRDAPAGTTWWGCSTTDGGAENAAAWARLYHADGDQEVMQEDGSMKKIHITEFSTILEGLYRDVAVMKKDGPTPNGIWVGGNKHSSQGAQIETGNNNEYNFRLCMFLRKGEKGFVAVSTDGDCKGKACILLAEFDKNAGIPASMATVVALDFAKWLKESGTDQNF